MTNTKFTLPFMLLLASIVGVGPLRVTSVTADQSDIAVARVGRFLLSSRRFKAPVAQLDRALPSEGRGQGFESLRVRQ
jgi:hypothetical protein